MLDPTKDSITRLAPAGRSYPEISSQQDEALLADIKCMNYAITGLERTEGIENFLSHDLSNTDTSVSLVIFKVSTF